MLVNYKPDYEKIAMGFLSYETDLKDLGNLQTELKLYTTDDAHTLLLYRQDDGNFCGIIGLECGGDFVLVRHLDLSPAVRNQETVNAMLDELQVKVKDDKIMGSPETTPLIKQWRDTKKEQLNAADPSVK